MLAPHYLSIQIRPAVCSASKDSVKSLRQDGTRNFYVAGESGIIAAELGMYALIRLVQPPSKSLHSLPDCLVGRWQVLLFEQTAQVQPVLIFSLLM
jgi:hypothetical protein